MFRLCPCHSPSLPARDPGDSWDQLEDPPTLPLESISRPPHLATCLSCPQGQDSWAQERVVSVSQVSPGRGEEPRSFHPAGVSARLFTDDSMYWSDWFFGLFTFYLEIILAL